MPEDRGRSARSSRDRSARSIREPPQVYVIHSFFSRLSDESISFSDFEDVEQEEQEVIPPEPEIRITREELIARYQVCSSFLRTSILSFSSFSGC